MCLDLYFCRVRHKIALRKALMTLIVTRRDASRNIVSDVESISKTFVFAIAACSLDYPDIPLCSMDS